MHSLIREYLRGKYHYSVDLLFDWFGLICFVNETNIVSCPTADSKPVRQEVNSTLVFPGKVLSLAPACQNLNLGVLKHEIYKCW
jgi:hypothetical protein